MIKKLRARIRPIPKTIFFLLTLLIVGGLWFIHDNRVPLGMVGCGILKAEKVLPAPLFIPLRWALNFWAHSGDTERVLRAFELPVSAGDKEHELGEATALICDGVDLNVRNSQGDTPIMILLKQLDDGEEHYPPLIGMMLKYPIDVNEIDRNGDTALHLAVPEGHAPVMRRLLKHGADPRRTNSSGDTPLHLALRQPLSRQPETLQKQLRKIELLLSNSMGREAVSMRDRAGHPALHLVSLIPRTDVALVVLEMLLKTEPNLDVTDLDGNNPERFAQLQQMPEIAKRLAEFRADFTHKPQSAAGEIKH